MKNLMVKKPWGEEYIICKTNNSATWHLKINSRKKNIFTLPSQEKNWIYSFRWKS